MPVYSSYVVYGTFFQALIIIDFYGTVPRHALSKILDIHVNRLFDVIKGYSFIPSLKIKVVPASQVTCDGCSILNHSELHFKSILPFSDTSEQLAK